RAVAYRLLPRDTFVETTEDKTATLRAHACDRVEIYDTTLRDGSQGEGVSYTVSDKVRIAARLDFFGVAYIEGGWPGSNPKDAEFFERAKDMAWQTSQIAAFGSTRRA